MQISTWIIAFVAVYGGFGGFLFDAVIPATARQHQWNPAWPPHAKFHNGQTMMFGALNMIIALIILFALRPLSLPLLLVAAAVAETCFASMLLAPIFPGTAWSDPEFDGVNPRPLGLAIQKLLAAMATGLILVAVVLALLQS